MTVRIHLPCRGEEAEERRGAASKWTHQRGGLWPGGVLGTDLKERVFVWEQWPSSAGSCSSSDSAVSQRVAQTLWVSVLLSVKWV